MSNGHFTVHSTEYAPLTTSPVSSEIHIFYVHKYSAFWPGREQYRKFHSIFNYLNLEKNIDEIGMENITYFLTKLYIIATEPMKAHVGNRDIVVVILNFGTSCM